MKKKAILIALALLCSFAQGVWAYTVTIYEASGIGFAYGAAHLSSGIDGVAFNLNTPDTPAYMKFKGWRMNPTTVPTSWEYVEGEVLTNGIIKPDGDVTVYACYEYVYGTEWTWASDYSSATVKITSLEHQDDTGNVVEASRITSSVQEAPAYGTPDEITYTATATMLRTSDDKVFTFTDSKTMWLANLNEDDNTKVLGYFNNVSDKTATVSLTGRTLFKDGNWNTLCLPFSVALDDSPLKGATLMTLSSASFSAGTLTLDFDEVSHSGEQGGLVEAGKPYLIKWESGDPLTENDLIFRGVTVSNAANDISHNLGSNMSVTFKGTYQKLIYTASDCSILFLGSGNTLYYPKADAYIGAQRAYFQLTGLTAGDKADGVRSLVLNFADGEASGIMDALENSSKATGRRDSGNLFTHHSSLSGWYTLDGRRLSGKPATKGLYINSGKKVIIR